MPLKFTEGDTFPDHTLTDHSGAELSISQVAGDQPLLLAFYRGPWWPKWQLQLRELVQFHQATQVANCKIAVVSPDPPKVQEAFRAGLGATFPFLSDGRLELTDALGIRETTDKRHGPLAVPYTFALLPGLTIHRIFNGWYMGGRPTPEELRQTMRQLLKATRPDFDFPGE